MVQVDVVRLFRLQFHVAVTSSTAGQCVLLLFDSSGRRSRNRSRRRRQRLCVEARRREEVILFLDVGRILMLLLLVLLLMVLMVGRTDQAVPLIVVGEIGVFVIVSDFGRVAVIGSRS